jgi:predicted ATP-grasp superfamily ATP-dependent carboligase
MNSDTAVEVLVTDGNRRPSLAVIRSLARNGVSFVVLGEERGSLAFSSRYAKHTEVCPSPVAEPDQFFEHVLSVVKKRGIRLVIPILEESLLVLDRRRDEIEPHARLAAANSEAFHTVMDKRLNLALARQLDIACPRLFEMQHIEQLPQLIDAIGFPMVLKPPGSPHDPRLPSFPFKVLYANDESQLRTYLDKYCADGIFPMFQECITGQSHNLCCFVVKGEIVAMHEHLSHRSLKGHGVLREIVTPTPEGVEGARKMLRALQWDGVAQFSFFIEAKSQQLRYMEVNGRFWSSIAGSVHAGWDFPYWVYRYFLHAEQPKPKPIKIGSRTCWHRGDLVALVNYLAGGELPSRGQHPGKLRAIVSYLAGFNPSIHADAFAWDDPLPELVDHWQVLRHGVTALARGLDADSERLSAPPP